MSTKQSRCSSVTAVLVAFSWALAALLPGRADAGLIITTNEGNARASAVFSGTSLPPQSAETTFGPFGGVAVADIAPFGGRVRAAQTGFGLNAVTAEGRLGDIPGFVLSASTDIRWTIENDGAVAQDLIFDYTINGGELRTFGPGGAFASDLEATVAASIFVIAPGFGGFLWEWGATLRDTGGSVETQIHGVAPLFDLNDPLGLGTPALSSITTTGRDSLVSIAPFTATVDLGTLAPGATALITYSMFANVSGPGLNNTGGKATLGDPFDLAGNPGSTISIRSAAAPPTAVPEPSTLVLSLLGLTTLLGPTALTRRRASAPLAGVR